MSNFWSGFIIVIVVSNIIGCAVLLYGNRKMSATEAAKETTGHTFDGIEERNAPLPRWWLFVFWATLVYSIGYLLFYPGMGSFAGVLGWSSDKQWQQEVEIAQSQSAPLFERYASTPIEDLWQSPQAMDLGSRLFSNNCAVCHGSDARGGTGYPNLTDNDWLYGDTPKNIKDTLTHGRNGMMPAMAAAIGGTDKAVRDLALYVASLSKPQLAEQAKTRSAVARGKPKFMICAACHGPEGKGNTMMGAPNLADNVWLYGATLEDIETTIKQGRSGVMPAQKELLSEQKIHILTAYVYGLSRRDEVAPTAQPQADR